MTIREYILKHPPPPGIQPHTYFQMVSEAMGVNPQSVEKPFYQLRKKNFTQEVEPDPPPPQPIEKYDARILVFDIETAPLKAYVWGKWGQNIQDSFLIRDWFMLTWAAKWLFEDKVYSERLTGREVMEENDERITRSIWKMLDEATIIVAHNGVKFDVKRLNTRFLKYRLGHPSPYKVIDTLRVARKEFSLTSNRLDYIAHWLGIPGKQETSKGLWQRCSEGCDESLGEMESYNIQDVRLLEEVYLILRPYIRSHPNIGLHIQDHLEVCGSCGSNNLTEVGEYQTMMNLYVAYRCGNCQSLSRQKNSRLSLKDRRHLTKPIS